MYCIFCQKGQFKNKISVKNHERSCIDNPNRIPNKLIEEYNKKISSGEMQHWAKGLTLENDVRIKSKVISEEQKEKIRESVKRAGTGGYKPNAGRSKKFSYIDSFGKETTLQSSYELKLAEVLDKNKIRWLRPSHIPYIKDGINKKYFPDFYLVDHDMYVDTKNDYLRKIDELKISLVVEQNRINIKVLGINEIETFCSSIVEQSADKR